jgi:hypothetical protein
MKATRARFALSLRISDRERVKTERHAHLELVYLVLLPLHTWYTLSHEHRENLPTE